ncbi:MAG: hypothetical protein ACHQNT_08100 [Bacteroidia bacterium]
MEDRNTVAEAVKKIVETVIGIKEGVVAGKLSRCYATCRVLSNKVLFIDDFRAALSNNTLKYKRYLLCLY